MPAKLVYRDKYVYSDEAIREMLIWRLPEQETERPHDLKYRLFYGYPGQALVRYDNERTKDRLLCAPWDVIGAHVRLVA